MWVLLVLFLQANPHASADNVAQGDKAYRIHCARCHGLAGEGGRGPNLADRRLYHRDTDDDLFCNARACLGGTGLLGSGPPTPTPISSACA